jgi:hypothetical protein
MEQQIAIFEKSPDISNFSISSINSSQQSGNSVLWQQASVSFSMATSTFIFSNTNM